MKSLKLADGFTIREMTSKEFFPLFGKHYDSIFGDDHTFFPETYYSVNEKEKIDVLRERMGNLFQLNLGLFSPDGEFIGFSFGVQESEETFYMMASAILEPFRKKGFYSLLLDEVVERCKEEGFQKIYGTHCATNNSVLIPKLKRGFVFSKIELSDMFGTIIHLQYYTNPLRRKVLDYRSGLRVPGKEIKKIMKFDREPGIK
ncbi:MAG: GNAT family N-acetyltransferase [Bacteriovorax sp.]|nr:GNAT family N-acetyltransferase [Bacteriovorax sp.]